MASVCSWVLGVDWGSSQEEIGQFCQSSSSTRKSLRPSRSGIQSLMLYCAAADDVMLSYVAAKDLQLLPPNKAIKTTGASGNQLSN
ncbi:hypothetical protein STEG23_026717, partial [Scotinomys teguina]